MDLDKIAHLPLIFRTDTGHGPIGYYNVRPVEVGALAFDTSSDPDTRMGRYQKELPAREVPVWVLGRSTTNNVIIGDYIERESGVVPEGHEIPDAVDYRVLARR